MILIKNKEGDKRRNIMPTKEPSLNIPANLLQEVIEDLVDKNYTILDEHYENSGHQTLDKFQNQRYKEFQQKYDTKDKDLQERLLKESELLLINNTNNTI